MAAGHAATAEAGATILREGGNAVDAAVAAAFASFVAEPLFTDLGGGGYYPGSANLSPGSVRNAPRSLSLSVSSAI